MTLLEKKPADMNGRNKKPDQCDDDGILVCVEQFKREAISSLRHPDEDPPSQILNH